MATVVEPNRKSIPKGSRPEKPRRRRSGGNHSDASKQGFGGDPSHPFAAERRRWDRVSWWAIGWLTLAHLICFAAPFTFTWAGLVVAVLLHWMTGSLGICLGYHRLLTHSGMKTYSWVRYLFATIGSLAGEGSPLDWVADHRKHHAYSDQDGDPHSPHDGSWWSHMLWLTYRTYGGSRKEYLQRWVPDLLKDPGMRLIDVLFLPMHIVMSLALLGIGYAVGGWQLGISLLVWGMFLRLVLVLHATWLVNSASHMWGYRNYETTDDSRNNWFVAIIAYGEGWHNNHHAYPRMAKHGHRWWEFDITWQAIKCLRACGLVWDVVDYRTAAEKRNASVSHDRAAVDAISESDSEASPTAASPESVSPEQATASV